jgi:hypothetical protein
VDNRRYRHDLKLPRRGGGDFPDFCPRDFGRTRLRLDVVNAEIIAQGYGRPGSFPDARFCRNDIFLLNYSQAKMILSISPQTFLAVLTHGNNLPKVIVELRPCAISFLL